VDYITAADISCNQFDVISCQIWRIQCNNAKWRPLHSTRLFNVTDSETNQKLIRDLILVNIMYLRLILHHFQVIADYWLNWCFRQGYLSLTNSFGVNC